MKLFEKGKNQEGKAEEAILLHAGIEPDTKRRVDTHNLEAKKQAEALLPKFEGLLKLLHERVKEQSIEKLGERATSEQVKAIKNTLPGDVWGKTDKEDVWIESGVGLGFDEKVVQRKILNYIKKNLQGIVIPNDFMGNSYHDAIKLVLETMAKLRETTEEAPQEVGSKTRASISEIIDDRAA